MNWCPQQGLSLRASAYNAAALHLSYAGELHSCGSLLIKLRKRPLEGVKIAPISQTAAELPALDELPQLWRGYMERFSNCGDRHVSSEHAPDLNYAVIQTNYGTTLAASSEAHT